MVESLLTKINPDVGIFLATSLFAFVAWIVKGLIDKPLSESKATFNLYLEKRIEILTEVKANLGFIVYFPGEEDSKEFKEPLQQLLLKNNKAGYLNKTTFDAVLRISVDPITNKKFVLETIKEIDEDLYKQISNVYDEAEFYRRFSNYNPFKRFIGFTILSIQYLLSLSFVVSAIFTIAYGLLFTSLIWKIAIIVSTIIGSLLINKWMKK